MEDSIKNLDNYTDEATKQTLQALVDKKRKFDGFKKKEFSWRMLCIASIGLFFLYLYYFIVVNVNSFSLLFAYIFDDSLHFYVIMFIGIQIAIIKYYLMKKDKAEKEYHELRKEIVKRSDDYWKQTNEWKQRHHVFAMMKKEFDINLYHEGK